MTPRGQNHPLLRTTTLEQGLCFRNKDLQSRHQEALSLPSRLCRLGNSGAASIHWPQPTFPPGDSKGRQDVLREGGGAEAVQVTLWSRQRWDASGLPSMPWDLGPRESRPSWAGVALHVGVALWCHTGWARAWSR